MKQRRENGGQEIKNDRWKKRRWKGSRRSQIRLMSGREEERWREGGNRKGAEPQVETVVHTWSGEHAHTLQPHRSCTVSLPALVPGVCPISNASNQLLLIRAWSATFDLRWRTRTPFVSPELVAASHHRMLNWCDDKTAITPTER